jgi:hypothetical protein
VFYFFDAVLDYIANRHDADELSLLYHRHMAEFARGHAAHQAFDGVVFGAGVPSENSIRLDS